MCEAIRLCRNHAPKKLGLGKVGYCTKCINRGKALDSTKKMCYTLKMHRRLLSLSNAFFIAYAEEKMKEKQIALFDIIPGSLDSLADEINDAHKQLEGHFKYTLNYAIYAGECLIKAKALCGHGKWLEWRDREINHSVRTSQTYMKFAEHKEFILANAQNFAHLGIDGARKLLPDYKGVLSSKGIEWWTPKIYIEAIREVMGDIDLDPASCADANKIVGAKKYYTEDSDGLIQTWRGRIFLNPPYGRLGPEFIGKLYNELGSTVSEAVVLVNSRATDAVWFHPLFEGIICFTDHRIDFDSPNDKPTSSTHGSCFIYFGSNKEKFAEIFSQFGNIVRRWP